MRNHVEKHRKKINSLFNNKNIIAVYLIGSYAQGSERADSDLDIAIVLQTLKDFNYDSFYSQMSDFFPDKNVDLRIVMATSTSPLFLFQIIKHGILLFEQSRNERLRFENYALKIYYDTQHLRDIYNYYLDKRFTTQLYGR